jgi:hypothetical protein
MAVDRDMLTRVWDEMDYRINKLLPKVDILSICEIRKKKTWKVSLSIGVRISMIRCVVYLLRIFKIFHGMNSPV